MLFVECYHQKMLPTSLLVTLLLLPAIPSLRITELCFPNEAACWSARFSGVIPIQSATCNLHCVIQQDRRGGELCVYTRHSHKT